MIPDPGPRGWIPDSTLNPRIHGIDNTIIATILTATAFFLSQPQRSIAKEIMFSNTAMTVDSAAKDKNRKNSVHKLTDSMLRQVLFLMY